MIIDQYFPALAEILERIPSDGIEFDEGALKKFLTESTVIQLLEYIEELHGSFSFDFKNYQVPDPFGEIAAAYHFQNSATARKYLVKIYDYICEKIMSKLLNDYINNSIPAKELDILFHRICESHDVLKNIRSNVKLKTYFNEFETSLALFEPNIAKINDDNHLIGDAEMKKRTMVFLDAISAYPK